MNTPIYDFIRAYAAREGVRFHMPGHKGHSLLGVEAWDITEIAGADVLGEARGIIGESEQNAATLFGTARTLYSTEGSTLAIKAMLTLAAGESPTARPTVIAARNVHKAFIYAAALLDLKVAWLYPEGPSHLCECAITPHTVETAIRACGKKPCAVYLTSPDYLGHTADIRGISAVCRVHGVPLLVDNAHGAYLRFLEPSRHPMDLGADMCCDSAHKTLPALTGGAYLHIAKTANPAFSEKAKAAMSLFGSTSPSYLTLASLDLCNRYLAEGYRHRLSACVRQVDDAKTALRAMGFTVEESEPLKLVIRASASGLSGETLGDILRETRIEPEFCDPDVVVLMVTPENTESDMERLSDVLSAVTHRDAHAASIPALPRGEAVLSIREAVLSRQETVRAADAEGRICGAPTVSCPPAVPIVVSGERITPEATQAFRYYGIDTVSVVKPS